MKKTIIVLGAFMMASIFTACENKKTDNESDEKTDTVILKKDSLVVDSTVVLKVDTLLEDETVNSDGRIR